jgi:hypothetical protein
MISNQHKWRGKELLEQNAGLKGLNHSLGSPQSNKQFLAFLLSNF